MPGGHLAQAEAIDVRAVPMGCEPGAAVVGEELVEGPRLVGVSTQDRRLHRIVGAAVADNSPAGPCDLPSVSQTLRGSEYGSGVFP